MATPVATNPPPALATGLKNALEASSPNVIGLAVCRADAANVSRTGYTGLRLHVSGGAPGGSNVLNWSSVSPPQLVVCLAGATPTPTPTGTLPTQTPTPTGPTATATDTATATATPTPTDTPTATATPTATPTGPTPTATATPARCLPADANGDCCVTGADYLVVLGAYGACSGEGSYNAGADFNGDTCITGADYLILLVGYGECATPTPTPTSTPSPTPT